MEEKQVLILGNTASGKTKLIFRIKLSEAVTTIPTIGYNMETVDISNKHIILKDVGGQEKIRFLWKEHYSEANGLIYVYDVNDANSFDASVQILKQVLVEPELEGLPMLIMANKIDLGYQMDPSSIVDAVGQDLFNGRDYIVFPCSAENGDGVADGMDWLASQLK